MSSQPVGVAVGEQTALFQSIVQSISQTMNLPASVWIPDEKGQALKIAASVGLPASYVREAFLQLSEPSVTGDSFKNGTVVTIRDVLSEPNWKYADEAREMGWKSALCVPIFLHEKVIGIISIYTFVMRDFPDEEKQLIAAFASQISLTLEAERGRKALRRLNEVSPLLVSVPSAPSSLEEILQKIVENAQEVLGAELIDLYQYIQSRDVYTLPPVQVGKRNDPSVRKDKVHEDDVVYSIVRSKQPMYVEKAQEETTLTQPFKVMRPDRPSTRFVIREKVESTSVVPLLAGTEVVGVLFANYRSPQTFPSEQRELIGLFANQSAIAIRNARLFERLKALIDFGRAIASGVRVREV